MQPEVGPPHSAMAFHPRPEVQTEHHPHNVACHPYQSVPDAARNVAGDEDPGAARNVAGNDAGNGARNDAGDEDPGARPQT